MFKAHNDTCIKDISCSMSSAKFATCSDDGTARVFDFATSRQEMVFQEHNSEVNSVDWHPFQSLVVTGSKDHTIRIWDARSASSRSIFQVQAHNSTVLQTRWNPINGIYLLTASRDMKVKLFDIRCLRKSVNEFDSTDSQIQQPGSRQETVVSWHPFHEQTFASACQSPGITFWHTDYGKLYEI